MPWILTAMFAGSAAVLAFTVWRLATDKKTITKDKPGPVLAVQAIGAGLIVFMLQSCGEPEPRVDLSPAQQYPGPWRNDYRVDIQRALSAAGAGACMFYYRASATSPGEFLTYCPGGRVYLVWIPSGRAMGPLQLSPDIPAPE